MKHTQISVAICGHAKHGKSTLAGRLLYELGAIDDRALQKAREDAEERNRDAGGRDFNEFSILFLKSRSDTFTKNYIPTDPSRTVFPERGSASVGDDHIITLIDTPGYSQYINNIVYGIYLADYAIMVVDAAKGVETVNVARVLASFTMPVVAILVTKMDLVGYSQERFDQVKEEIEKAILPIFQAYLSQDPPIIPVSALVGMGFNQNDAEGKMVWYQGISARQALTEVERNYNPGTIGKIRWTIEGSQEIYASKEIGTVLVGALETGVLRTGERLIIEPASTNLGEHIIVKARNIRMPRSVTESNGAGNLKSAQARALVAVRTSGPEEKELNRYFKHGGVLGTPDNRPAVANMIEAEVIFFEPGTFYNGKEYVIYTSASRGTARIIAIKDRDMIYFELPDTNKQSVVAGEHIFARLRFDRLLCIEFSREFQRLTRFILREHNQIVACGRCMNIV